MEYGINKRDITYTDGSYKPSGWSYERPVKASTGSSLKHINKRQKLYQIAAAKVVDHIEEINPVLIDSVPPAIWSHVWDGICERGLDTYQVFLMFAKVLGSSVQFRCHGRHMKYNTDASGIGSGSDCRERYLAQHLLPPERFRHRIEYVHVSSRKADDGPPTSIYSTYLHPLHQVERLQHIVLLDLTGVSVDRPSLISLMQLSRLVGLDVSGCAIYDLNVLPFWKTAMHHGRRWSNLRLLCLGTTSNQHSLSTVSSEFCSLLQVPSLWYLEGPKLASQEPPPPLPATTEPATNQWKSARELGLAPGFTKKYGLAWKLQYVYRKLRSVRPPDSVYHDIQLGTCPQWAHKTNNAPHCYFRTKGASSASATNSLGQQATTTYRKADKNFDKKHTQNGKVPLDVAEAASHRGHAHAHPSQKKSRVARKKPNWDAALMPSLATKRRQSAARTATNKTSQ